MLNDSLILGALLTLLAVSTIGAALSIHRGLGVRLTTVAITLASATALGGFAFGRLGASPPALGIAFLAILPPCVLAFRIIRGLVEPARVASEAALAMAGGRIEPAATGRAGAKGLGELGELQAALEQVRAYLADVHATIERIASGDLTFDVQPVSDHDAIGGALGRMVTSLRDAIGGVTASADGLSKEYGHVASTSSAANEAVQEIATRLVEVADATARQMADLDATMGSIERMARTIGEVSRGAEEQASAVGAAATVTAAITDKITRVAENARAGARGTSEAVAAARSGADTIEANLRRMQSIKRSTLKVQEKVDLMGQGSEQIGSIVEVIEGIASQTNLLALNAAIEAARAGEHGRGFAVVADEVRKLAEKSAVATGQIAELIGSIRGTVAETVVAIGEEVAEVEAGASHSNEAAAALASIVDTVETIRRQMADISAATLEISEATGTLSGAMESVSAVVEENSAATAEIASRSAEVGESVRSYMEVSQATSSTLAEVNAAAQRVGQQEASVAEAIRNISDRAATLQQQVLRLTTARVSGKVSRGNALIGRIDFVKDKFGAGAWEKVLRSLQPDQERILRSPIDPEGAYPPELLGALTSAIRSELAGGSDDILREMTRYRARFDIRPGAPLAQHFRRGDPGFIVHRMDLCLRHNWGEGVVVRNVDLGPKHVRMEVDMGGKQPRERCTYNHVGWMEGVIEASGGVPTIRKTRCMHDGAPFCEYDVRWETSGAGAAASASAAPGRAA